MIADHTVSKDSLNGSLAPQREVFRLAIKDAVASVIVVHNTRPTIRLLAAPIWRSPKHSEAAQKIGIPSSITSL